MQFGKFSSVEAFIESYVVARREEEAQMLAGLPLDVALGRKRARKERDVVEVNAGVAKDLGVEVQGAKHQHLLIKVITVVEIDRDVADDVERVRLEHEDVFVSIRYGDRMGLREPVPGIASDLKLHVRGEWIPKEKAYAHGGERMSVLHFTHEPLGFICTPDRCYS